MSNILHIDFAPHGAMRELTRLRPLGWVLAVAALAVSLIALAAWRDDVQRQEAHQAELTTLQQRAATRVRKPAAVTQGGIGEEQADAVNSAVQQLNLPWSGLLAALERATPARVALLELTPDAKRHLVKGVAETGTPEMMTDYIRRLKEQPFFGRVVLTRHEARAEQTDAALRFEFEAEWLQGRP